MRVDKKREKKGKSHHQEVTRWCARIAKAFSENRRLVSRYLSARDITRRLTVRVERDSCVHTREGSARVFGIRIGAQCLNKTRIGTRERRYPTIDKRRKNGGEREREREREKIPNRTSASGLINK